MQELLSLLDTLSEQVKVGAVALDFVDGQVDEHTGDLGCALGTHQLGHELEDARADGLLVRGVDLDDGGVDGCSLGVEFLGHGLIRGSELNSVGHWHVGHRHWHLGDGLADGHRHGATLHLVHHRLLVVSHLLLTTALVTTLSAGSTA